MRKLGIFFAVGTTTFLCPGLAQSPSAPLHTLIRSQIDADYPRLENLYKELHAHPELSYHEEKTAARIAAELKQAGLEVATNIGGHGVVGVLRNGTGPTILLRT